MFSKVLLKEKITSYLHTHSNEPGIQKYYYSEDSKVIAINICDALFKILDNDLTCIYDYIDDNYIRIHDIFGEQDIELTHVQLEIFNYLLDLFIINGKYPIIEYSEIICIR